MSYKKRTHYFENKQQFPKKKLKTKSIEALIEQWIIDERWFFLKWKKILLLNLWLIQND
jgi:hypothetical protein